MSIDDKHDWSAVADALHDLQADTQENEPHAVNLIAAIEQVLSSLPDH